MDKRYFAIAAAIVGLCQLPAIGEETKEIELEKVIITNRRAASGLSEATENVAVVTEDQIEQLPARDLGEALQYVSGVDIEPNEGFGRSTAISIQGCDSRQVRVMIDGIPLNSQSSGQVDPSKFPLENISRIEIIKGASSSVWGSGLGGVINIITKDTGKTLVPEGKITSSFAEFRTRKQDVELDGKISELGYYLFSSYMQSGGMRPRADTLEKKSFGKLSYDLKGAGKILASFGYSGLEVDNGEQPDNSWTSQSYRNRYGKIGWEKEFGLLRFGVDFKHFRQDITTRFYAAVDDLEPFLTTEFKDLLYQLSLNSSLRLRDEDLLVLGADFDYDAVKTNLYLSKAKNLKLQAPYLNYSLKLQPWDLNFGLRYDNNSEFGSQLSPSLGLVYHFKAVPGALVRATVSRAFTAPPLIWKYNYSVDMFAAPNPGIQAERAWVYEAGLEAKPFPRLKFNCSVYRADVTNVIAAAINDEGLVFMKNYQKFIRQGGELQLRVNIFKDLDFLGSAALNDIRDTSTGKIVKGGGKTRRSFKLGLEYKNISGLSLALYGYYDFWNEPDFMQAHDKRTLCDLKASQDFKYVSLFLTIHNLGNSKYWRDFRSPLPGRYFEGGTSIRW